MNGVRHSNRRFCAAAFFAATVLINSAGCRREAAESDVPPTPQADALFSVADPPTETEAQPPRAGAFADSMTPPSLATDPTSISPPDARSAAMDPTPAAPHEPIPPPIAETPRLQLAPQLPPPRLADFLKLVDIEMRNVASGRRPFRDVAEANAELKRLSQLKLQAATQLEERSQPTDPERLLAIRGQLQALSHLAGLGDLDSALKLEKLAQAHRTSEDTGLASDSLLVLTGLEMEKLQNGTTTDSAPLLTLIDRIVASPQPPDISALMVMGQALAVLRGYGDDEGSEQIRLAILDAFAEHPNQAVAEMAVGLAGAPQFEAIDQAIRDFLEGRSVETQRWREIVRQTLEGAPEIASVRYLAGASLQFEAGGNAELSEATFEELTGFEGLDEDCVAEIRLASQAAQARREIIGQIAEIELPSADGTPLSLSDLQGRVVLMPFWAIAIPDSLAVLQTLETLRQKSPDEIEIIGMNLDDEDAPVDEFLEQSPVAFRSFRSRPKAPGGSHEIAARFGVVSLPFVVILDRQGRVSAINLTGRKLPDQVERAMAP